MEISVNIIAVMMRADEYDKSDEWIVSDDD